MYRTNVSATVKLLVLKLVELSVSIIEHVQVANNVEGVRSVNTIENAQVVKNVKEVLSASMVVVALYARSVVDPIYVFTINIVLFVYSVGEVKCVSMGGGAHIVENVVDLKYVITIE